MKIFKEKSGIIGAYPFWVFRDNKGYLYTADTLLALIKTIIFEWRQDKHLVG